MKTLNRTWTVGHLVGLRDKIDPSPQFQRGPVWRLPDKQLLIDSILRGLDIPKIYLWVNQGGGYEYSVADGQQRLRAIWGYLDNEFALGDASDNLLWPRSSFDDLPEEGKKEMLQFKIVTAVVSDAAHSEVRELFLRLQKGMRLLPPEIRNAIPSQLGDTIRAIAGNHGLFQGTTNTFPAARRKPDDLVAHAFLLELRGGAAKDLKAPELREMYEEYASGVGAAIERKVYRTLDYMGEMQSARPKCIRTKWGFVDLYWIISERRSKLPSAQVLADKYIEFENRRLKYVSHPDALLDLQSNKNANRDLYDYIVAFKSQGGLKENMKMRHEVLSRILLD